MNSFTYWFTRKWGKRLFSIIYHTSYGRALIKGRALFRPSSHGLKMPSCNILAGIEGNIKTKK
jgi:hypothetical protein